MSILEQRKLILPVTVHNGLAEETLSISDGGLGVEWRGRIDPLIKRKLSGVTLRFAFFFAVDGHYGWDLPQTAYRTPYIRLG